METFKSFISEAKEKKMFIDDERNPKKIKFDYIVRNYKEVMKNFDKYGSPSYISFDHDLGEKSKTGFDVAKNMVERDLDKKGGWIPKNFTYDVHSANPVGKKNISGLLDNYLEKRKKMVEIKFMFWLSVISVILGMIALNVASVLS